MSTHLEFDLTTRPHLDVFAHALCLAVTKGPAARRPASRSAVSVLVSCRSPKMAEAFLCESAGEAEAMSFADVLEEVEAYRPQPVELRYLHDGKVRRAFPDLGLAMLDGSVELWECKPERADRHLVERLRALRLALQTHGVAYRVRTPTWHRRAPHLSNVRELLRHCERPLREQLASDVAPAMSGHQDMRLGELRKRLGLSHADACAAIARGVLAAEIGGHPIGDCTVIRRARTGARSGAYIADNVGAMFKATAGRSDGAIPGF